MKTRQNKLKSYLAVTAGVGCVSSASAQTVTFYGVDSANEFNENPLGLNFESVNYGINTYLLNAENIRIAGETYYNNTMTVYTGAYYTRPVTTTIDGGSTNVLYSVYGFLNDGFVTGDQNFLRLSFDGDEVYEAVAQFNFDGTGGGFLVAIATTNEVDNPQDLSGVGGAGLSITEGQALIAAASPVPEPSSIALLALGATGLIARRRRHAA